MRQYEIILEDDTLEFRGEYLRERETTNWHYYRTDDGKILHCRKDKMVAVIESEVGDE